MLETSLGRAINGKKATKTLHDGGIENCMKHSKSGRKSVPTEFRKVSVLRDDSYSRLDNHMTNVISCNKTRKYIVNNGGCGPPHFCIRCLILVGGHCFLADTYNNIQHDVK